MVLIRQIVCTFLHFHVMTLLSEIKALCLMILSSEICHIFGTYIKTLILGFSNFWVLNSGYPVSMTT